MATVWVSERDAEWLDAEARRLGITADDVLAWRVRCLVAGTELPPPGPTVALQAHGPV